MTLFAEDKIDRKTSINIGKAMTKIQVLGGNHYFGKKLVQLLVNDNHDVTILNRGNKDDGLGSAIKRIICDRNESTRFKEAIKEDFDIVFDQCCFDYDQAKLACDI